MMGELPAGQGELIYDFNLEKHVPEGHLLRQIDGFLDFTELRAHLKPYYSQTGRPSVDPELMLRMLIIGYCYGIRSERRLCEEVHLNLAYRWFCRLGLDGPVPDHSTFSKNRHGRFRESELFRRLFEQVVKRCMDEGLVGGEGFAIDASLIMADTHQGTSVPGYDDDWPGSAGSTRAVREYFEALEREAFANTPRKKISLTDPLARWTAASGGFAYFAYSTNYLIDVENAVIVDVEATPANRTDEVASTRTMLERVEQTFSLKPERLIGDAAYGNAPIVGWLVEQKHIAPHVPLWDKSDGKPGLFGRSEFTWEPETDRYICPAGHPLQRNLRPRKTSRGVTKDNTIIYRARHVHCTPCPMKTRCCPKGPSRKIHRSVHEDARDLVRSLMTTDAYEQSRRDRKKVEMLFAHLKRILNLDRLRLRGLTGAHDEFVLAATAQNLRKLAKRVCRPPPYGAALVPA